MVEAGDGIVLCCPDWPTLDGRTGVVWYVNGDMIDVQLRNGSIDPYPRDWIKHQETAAAGQVPSMEGLPGRDTQRRQPMNNSIWTALSNSQQPDRRVDAWIASHDPASFGHPYDAEHLRELALSLVAQGANLQTVLDAFSDVLEIGEHRR